MNGYLLDTHAFLWWVDDAPQIPLAARAVIADPGNECFLSVASCWEMAIKASLGKLELARPVAVFVAEQLAANDFRLLNVELKHVGLVEKLPFHHRDPFDRLLVAQAKAERLTLLSADAELARYGVRVLW